MSGSRAMQRVEEALESHGYHHRGQNWQCPAHEDRNPSLSVSEGDGCALIHCHKGCTSNEVLDAIGLKLADLYDEPKRKRESHRRRITETYDYTDEAGDLLFQVVRSEPKSFWQRRPNATGGWTRGLGNTRRVLYRLPEVIAALKAGDPVYIVEGEKDVEAVRSRDLTATCSPMGAGKWRDKYAEIFAPSPDADVRIVADRDEPGYSHAADIRASLGKVGLSPRCFEAGEGKDVSDHLASGLRIEELVEISVAEKLSEQPMSEGPAAAHLDPSRFFSEKTLIVPRLGRVVRDAGHVKVGIDNRLYSYKDGVYHGSGDTFVRNQVRELLGDLFKRRHTEEVLSWFRSDFSEIGDDPSTDRINVQNGLLDWKSEKLQKHTPDFLSTIQLPGKWNPKARCPRIETFLNEVISEDALEFIEEVIGYTLYHSNPMRKAVMLLGLGCNGKSVLLNLIQALAGSHNVSNVSLQALTKERFYVAQLQGKIANICGDLDARTVQHSEIFKKVTGGDSVTGEWKYKDPFSFKPFTLLLFSANELPHTSDQTPAWFGRWLIIPMETRIKKVDPHLTAKLTSTAELEGLLVLAVRGLQRLMRRGSFKIPESVQAAGDRYRDRVDSVRAFFNEFCEFNLSISTDRVVLYESYSHWMKNGNRPPISNASFYEYIRRNYADQIREKTVHGRHHFHGIRYLGETTGDLQKKNEDQS